MIRKFLYLLVGLLLGANLTLSFAANKVWYLHDNAGPYTSASAACSAYAAAVSDGRYGANTYTGTPINNDTACHYACSQGTYCDADLPLNVACSDGTAVRQDGSCGAPPENCPMFDGSDKTTLTKPSTCQCPEGTDWMPYMGCRKKCAVAANQTVASISQYVIPKYSGFADAPCAAGCQVFPGEGSTTLSNGSFLGTAVSTGWACAGSGPGSGERSPTPKDTTPVDPTKVHDPVCGAGEGVGTSSSGRVLCIPPGTPDTSVPVVKKRTDVETYPDNSTKTRTEVTTQDPNTGASTTVVIVVGTGGESGTGTTKTVTDQSGGGGGVGGGSGGGDGSCDPKKDFCGGPGTSGLYTKKSKTVAGVLGDFKNGVMSSSIGTAATGFFTVTTPGGGCPNWVVEVPYLNITLNLSQYFCTATAVNMMNLVGAVLLFVASFVGFRWAML